MSYFDKVYNVTNAIPSGRVSTYGAIADYLALGSARMVGWALNKCHNAEKPVAAHRVVNRKGELTGRNMFPHPDMMQQFLEKEGVIIKNNKVVEFDKHFWHPAELKKKKS
jgi:methylated-DNA-protein-cysteine methyltransferase-like protein